MRMRRRRTDWEAVSLKLAFAVLSGVAIVFLVAPSLVVILTSLTSSASLKFPPGGLSLRWYRELIDASYCLGASWWMTVRGVTLPLISRGIGAGAFLCFMASFDNVPVSLFLADERTEVLPIHLWQQIETNLDVRTAAASGLIVVFTLILMLLAERLAGLTRQMRTSAMFLVPIAPQVACAV